MRQVIAVFWLTAPLPSPGALEVSSNCFKAAVGPGGPAAVNEDAIRSYIGILTQLGRHEEADELTSRLS